MSRSLEAFLRRRHVIPALSVVTVTLAGVAVLAVSQRPRAHAMSDVAVLESPASPLRDTGVQRWKIEAPPETPAPVPVRDRTPAPAPAPAPEVNWGALALGAAESGLAGAAGDAEHAGIREALSPERARALVAQAEAEAAVSRGSLPVFVGVVVARGTPRETGEGPRCNVSRGAFFTARPSVVARGR
jgi:hypothetical protein